MIFCFPLKWYLCLAGGLSVNDPRSPFPLELCGPAKVSNRSRPMAVPTRPGFQVWDFHASVCCSGLLATFNLDEGNWSQGKWSHPWSVGQVGPSASTCSSTIWLDPVLSCWSQRIITDRRHFGPTCSRGWPCSCN